ncbi:MAG: superoxide dismutase [Nitrospinae bacterium]|nr:superoxide dismutase [Nitrospinota bacterium]
MTHATDEKSIILPDLPYPIGALAPVLSEETLRFHYGKHHQTYVDKLNSLLPASRFVGASLDTLVKEAEAGPLFNNAAQIWNHTFYWNGLSPDGGKKPQGGLAKAIDDSFGSFDAFKAKFTETGLNLFGSGWVWLVKGTDGKVAVIPGANAANPLRDGLRPLLTVDVWEHAFYIDYRNGKKAYLDAIWEIVNWRFAEENFAR